MKAPPAFCTGSMITIGDRLGALQLDRSATSSAHRSVQRLRRAQYLQRYRFVFATWRTPGISGSNGVWMAVMPVSESAP